MHIENGKPVIAIRDGKAFKKGASGILLRQGGIDSENYYYVEIDAGLVIGPSLEDYWKEAVPLERKERLWLAACQTGWYTFGNAVSAEERSNEDVAMNANNIPRYKEQLTDAQKETLTSTASAYDVWQRSCNE